MFKTAKTKLLALGATVLGSASLANAADLAIGQDGTITGSLNVAPFMTGAGAVVVALGAICGQSKKLSLYFAK